MITPRPLRTTPRWRQVRPLRRLLAGMAVIAASLSLVGTLPPQPASATTPEVDQSTDDRWLPTTGLTDLDRPFNETTWITAHNSFNTKYDPQPAYPHQNEGEREQLTWGVRGFMLDLHPQPNQAETFVCHVTCGDYPRALSTWMRFTFMDFINRNPKEIITLHLESHVTREQFAREVAGWSFSAGATFNPASWDTEGWPTVRQMIDANQRVVILGSNGLAGEFKTARGESVYVINDQHVTVENYWSMGDTIGSHDRSCVSRWNSIPLSTQSVSLPGKSWPRLFVMNQFHGWGTSGHASSDNSPSALRDRVDTYCAPAAGRVPNYIALDFVDKGNPVAYARELNQRPYTPAPVTPDPETPEPETPEPQKPFTATLQSTDTSARSVVLTGGGPRGATVTVKHTFTQRTTTAVIDQAGSWRVKLDGLGDGYQTVIASTIVDGATIAAPTIGFSMPVTGIDPGDPCNKPGSQFLPECDDR